MPQPLGVGLPKFHRPATNRLIGDVNPSFREYILDIAEAKCEAVVEPDRVLDNYRRKAMAAIGDRFHLITLMPDLNLAKPINVTIPPSKLH